MKEALKFISESKGTEYFGTDFPLEVCEEVSSFELYFTFQKLAVTEEKNKSIVIYQFSRFQS